MSNEVMTSYLVCWEIDIYAGSAYDAAEEALFIMQDRSNQALFFKVIESSTGHMTDVDLFGWEDEERAEILGETLSNEQLEEVEEVLYSEMYGKIK
jgi:hypothetical protein